MAHRKITPNESHRYPKLSPPPARFVSRVRETGHRVADFKKGDRVMWSDSFLKRGKEIDPKWFALRKNERGTVDWIQRDGDVVVQWDNEHITTVHPPERLAHATDRMLEETPHVVADFNTLDDLVAHARGEGATHVLQIDDETHIYFQRRDGAYEKAEAWQKDGYWHTQAPGSRAVVRKPPPGAKPIGGARARGVEAPRRSAHHHPGRRK